jgi:hypothetical protein
MLKLDKLSKIIVEIHNLHWIDFSKFSLKISKIYLVKNLLIIKIYK